MAKGGRRRKSGLHRPWPCYSEEERLVSLVKFIRWLLEKNRGNVIRFCNFWYQRVQFELGLLPSRNCDASSMYDYVKALCERYGVKCTLGRGTRRVYLLFERRELEKLLHSILNDYPGVVEKLKREEQELQARELLYTFKEGRRVLRELKSLPF